MSGRIYGYARVSSKEQNEQRQIQSLIENGVDERFLFVDKVSGSSMDRPQLNVLKNALREGDTLFIKSLDRISRSYEDTKKFFQHLQVNKIDIVVIDLPLLDTRQYKDTLGSFIFDLVVNILAYVSEQERSYIKKRQREGIDLYLKTGKTKTGNRMGRPSLPLPTNWNEVYMKWDNKEITAKKAMELLGGIKPNKFYAWVKEEKNKKKEV